MSQGPLVWMQWLRASPFPPPGAPPSLGLFTPQTRAWDRRHQGPRVGGRGGRVSLWRFLSRWRRGPQQPPQQDAQQGQSTPAPGTATHDAPLGPRPRGPTVLLLRTQLGTPRLLSMGERPVGVSPSPPRKRAQARGTQRQFRGSTLGARMGHGAGAEFLRVVSIASGIQAPSLGSWEELASVAAGS